MGAAQRQDVCGKHTVRLWGLPALTLKPAWLLIVLASGTLVCAIAFSTIQEKLFRTPGFHFGGFLTLSTYAVYLGLASLERRLTGDVHRHGSLQAYAWVSLLAMGGYYCTNWSLNYLNYATRVVWKSCKVLPVMALGTALNKRPYSVGQYASASTLVLGVTLFTLGDKETSPRFHPAGVALIAAALVMDALCTNCEERLFFRGDIPASHAEVVFYSSGFAGVYCLIILLLTGELLEAAAFVRAQPAVGGLLVASASAAYLSVCCVLLLIKHFDATHCEIVKSVRRVLQVLLSYAIYPKPVGWKVLSGGLVVFLSLAWFHNQQRRGRGKAQPDLVVNCDLEDGNGFHKSASQITLSDWSDTGQGEGSSDSPAEVEADPLTPRFGSKALLSPTRR